mmetsp:Transcript_52407/g.119503  ORF Transcript_52407/g.119503 Transcript_52407/m.119503 type:complete len:290 (+) Transcript_52407:488-1357(+)
MPKGRLSARHGRLTSGLGLLPRREKGFVALGLGLGQSPGHRLLAPGLGRLKLIGVPLLEAVKSFLVRLPNALQQMGRLQSLGFRLLVGSLQLLQCAVAAFRQSRHLRLGAAPNLLKHRRLGLGSLPRPRLAIGLDRGALFLERLLQTRALGGGRCLGLGKSLTALGPSLGNCLLKRRSAGGLELSPQRRPARFGLSPGGLKRRFSFRAGLLSSLVCDLDLGVLELSTVLFLKKRGRFLVGGLEQIDRLLVRRRDIGLEFLMLRFELSARLFQRGLQIFTCRRLHKGLDF